MADLKNSLSFRFSSAVVVVSQKPHILCCQVEKLVVTNKNTVKVYLRSTSGDVTRQPAQLYFTIGSVESFERQMDAVR